MVAGNVLNLSYERKLFRQGCDLIAGIDEAGRGPLAGPVVAACVVIDKNFQIDGRLRKVNDSKKLSEKQRETLFEEIVKNCLDVGIGVSNAKTIDKVNILQATLAAMRKAAKYLGTKPNIFLIDGRDIVPKLKGEQKAIVKGDAKVFAIAAASIIAKVTRDRIMKKYADQYPDYGFAVHKGYGTKKHLAALKKFGPSPIHRRSFAPLARQSNLLNKKK